MPRSVWCWLGRGRRSSHKGAEGAEGAKGAEGAVLKVLMVQGAKGAKGAGVHAASLVGIWALERLEPAQVGDHRAAAEVGHGFGQFWREVAALRSVSDSVLRFPE